MNKTLKVPKRLKDAAYRLKDNKIIYCGLPDDMKEVISIAQKQDVLATYYSSGAKDAEVFGIYEPYGDDAYCLPDDIEIVVEQEQTWWEKEGLILCKIEKQKIRTGWEINYPDGSNFDSETLDIPRCEGYEFVGFGHNDKIEKWHDIKSEPFGYLDKNDILWCNMLEGRTPSTATHTVWRKIEPT